MHLLLYTTSIIIHSVCKLQIIVIVKLMQLKMQQALASLLCLSCCVSAMEIVISVKGSDTPSCLDEQLIFCQSLVNVSKYVTDHKLNNVTIRINDTNYSLQGVANFSEVENITITGKGRSLTHINCSISEAGIAFDRSANITLKDFTISNCGATIVNTNSNLTGNGTAIQIIDCFDVDVSYIVVSRSISQGLTFINTGSMVRVTDSHFINNTVSRSQWLGGGALQILFYGTEDLNTNTDYVIADSLFLNNNASTRSVKEHDIFNSKYCERGGGIRIILFDNVCSNSNITLDKNTLEGNTAVFGGGALISVSGTTSHDKIQILNNYFIGNKVLAGGGGLDVGHTTHKKGVYPTYNTICISQSYFVNNSASFGGGLSMFVASVGFYDKHANNDISCTKCHFDTNTANGGAAVNIGQDIFKNNGAQFIGTFQFTDSSFENNMVIFSSSVLDNLPRSNGASDGSGAFFVSEVEVHFEGNTSFIGNNGTALYLDSTTAIFGPNSTVYFINNSGYQGGAILLFGKSVMYVGNIGSFHFYDNTATKVGGAICALTGGKHVFSYMKTCFLNVWHYKNVSSDFSFHFRNNSAIIGDDIYATSISSCNMLCSRQIDGSDVNDTDPFFTHDCYGNFTLSSSSVTHNIATSPVKMTISFKDVVMPGIAAKLKIVQYDEVGGDVSQLFPLTAKVQSSNHNAKVHKASTAVTSNSIVLLGVPGDEGELLFESQSIRHVIRFNLSHCGPGYVHEGKRCHCSKNYSKIHCEPEKFAAIASNYWAGYIINGNDSIATQYNLYTGVCLAEFCNPPLEHCNDDDLLCKLPASPDAKMLEERICGESRHGRLCGRCVSNKSVYYHSDSLLCGDNTYCQYGVPMYIALELLPVTVIFLIILLFNISLTSGAVYSFVFYVQIMSSITITAFGTIRIKDHITKGVVNFIQVFLGVFSFEIRSGPPLEFCIVQTKSIMTLFMIKYGTLAYALLLVLGTILIMKMHSCYSCVKLCRRCGRRNMHKRVYSGWTVSIPCAVLLSMCYCNISYTYSLTTVWYKWNIAFTRCIV